MDDGLYSGNQMADLISAKREGRNGGIGQFDKILIASLGSTHGFMPDIQNEHIYPLAPNSKVSAVQNVLANFGFHSSASEASPKELKSWSELCRYASNERKLLFTTAESYAPYFSIQNKYLNNYFSRSSDVATQAINIAMLGKNRHLKSFGSIDTVVMSFWGTTDTNIPLLEKFAETVLQI